MQDMCEHCAARLRWLAQVPSKHKRTDAQEKVVNEVAAEFASRVAADELVDQWSDVLDALAEK